MREQQPIPRRGFLIGGAAALAAAALAACGVKTREPEPQPRPAGPPTPKPVVTEGAPSRIPVMPPTGEGTPAAQPTADVIAAMKEAAGVKAPEAGQTVTSAAPTKEASQEPHIEKETVNLAGSHLTVDSLHGRAVAASTGGGEPRLSPTPGIPTGKELPRRTYADYVAKVWSFLANPSSIFKDPAGELKLAATAGAFESTDFPNVHTIFDSETWVLSVKLKLPQGQRVKPEGVEPPETEFKDRTDVTVLGHRKDKQGRDVTVISIADYTRETRDEPHLFFVVIPTFQTGDSSQWSLERIVKQEGCSFERSGDNIVIGFEGKEKKFQWEMNTLGEDLFDMAQNEAGVLWIEKTTNPIVPHPDSTIIEKLQEKPYDIVLQEGVPVILSGGNKLAGAKYDSNTNEWVWKEVLPEALGEAKVDGIFTTQEFRDWEGQKYTVVSYEVEDPVEKKTKYISQVSYEYIEKDRAGEITKRDRIAAYYVREAPLEPASLASRTAEADFTFIVPKELQERKTYCDRGHPNIICPPVPFVRVDIKGNPKTQDNPETQGFPVAPIAWVAVIDHARAQASKKTDEEIRQLRREYNNASPEEKKKMRDGKTFKVSALGPEDRYARPHNFSLVGGMLVKFIDSFPSVETDTATGVGYRKLKDGRDQVETFRAGDNPNYWATGVLEALWGLTSGEFQLGDVSFTEQESSTRKEFVAFFKKYVETHYTFKIS